MKRYYLFIIALILLMTSSVYSVFSQHTADSTVTDSLSEKVAYVFEIDQDIEPSAWRLTKRAFERAKNLGAEYIIVRLNTYGGLVNIADSIRSKFLSSKIPVIVYIENNAASAGALISIAADSIYMRGGARMGAASVVNQQGEIMPEKYQSYMRSTMRSTAEAHGKDTIIRGNDTILSWHRDPVIAEAMVDPRIEIDGVVDSGEILTFTTDEAIENEYCEGKVSNINELLVVGNIEDYKIERYEVTDLERIIGFLMSPALQSLLIMIIFGGLYFEIQTPGVGFPLMAALMAAALYFAPLYLEGIAANWEILIFILGLILIGIEIFAIPGFGVAGVTGILFALAGLVMSMVDNVVFDHQLYLEQAVKEVLKSFLIVSGSMLVSLVLSIYFSKKILTSPNFSRLVLDSVQNKNEGYIGVDSSYSSMVGKEGIAFTVLRPGGKVEIEGDVYDAISELGFIDKGEKVKVISYGTSQLHVAKPEDL
ncbi:MAG: NfeD family protein [Bacteroidales bacterium]